MSDDEGTNSPFSVEQKGDVDIPAPVMSSQMSATIGAGDGRAPCEFEFISVGDAEVRGSSFKHYHVYKISCSPGNHEAVFRRYSDFVWLSEVLSALYPGIIIPDLPPKKSFGVNEEFLQNNRRPGLQRFLNRLRVVKIISDSTPFQMFMFRTSAFDEGQSDMRRQLSSRSAETTLSAYSHYYADVIARTDPSIEQELGTMTAFLKSHKERLSELALLTSQLVATTAATSVLISKIAISAEQVAETERSYANIPEQRASLQTHFNDWQLDSKEVESSYSTNLQDQFTQELHDVKALLEVIAERDKLKSKAEKATAKAAKLAGNDKYRVQYEMDSKNARNDVLLAEAVTKIIVYDQFNLVWSLKISEYHDNMAAFAAAQSLYARRAYQNWDTVAKPESN